MVRKKRSTKDRDSLHMLIVEARFYDNISDELLRGATRVLDKAGARYDRVTVPGTLEIPAAIVIAMDAARRRRSPYDGVVALGCVIRGETYHFEIVANESASGLMQVQLDSGIPVANGILTTDTEEQARSRAAEKGRDCAEAAVEMANLGKNILKRHK